jgi:hypothetical protein
MDDLRHDIEAALRGLDYPATRNKLLTVAIENGASSGVIERIQQFPETADFLNEGALAQALGVTIPGTHPHGWE